MLGDESIIGKDEEMLRKGMIEEGKTMSSAMVARKMGMRGDMMCPLVLRDSKSLDASFI